MVVIASVPSLPMLFTFGRFITSIWEERVGLALHVIFM